MHERTFPIRIQSLPWKHPTMLAPLEGVSNPLFRDLATRRGGVGIVCTEFVRVADNDVSPKAMAKHVQKVRDVPLSVQVMGTHTEHMAEAAGAMARAGADVVDINLGCPAPRVVRKGAGSAMLKNPQLLYEVLCAMREQVPGLLSAKIRAGFDDASHAVEIARTVEATGVDFIVVHPRRRADFFSGTADWRIIRTLRAELRIPVVGNGDCWYAADAARMREETGCDAVMIGRPALRNPWIFQQIQQLEEGVEPVRPDGAMLLEYFEGMVDEFCREFHQLHDGPTGRVKEQITYLGRAVRDGGVFRKQALRCETMAEILASAREHLGHLKAADLDLDAAGEQRLERSGSVNVADEPVPDAVQGPGLELIGDGSDSPQGSPAAANSCGPGGDCW